MPQLRATPVEPPAFDLALRVEVELTQLVVPLSDLATLRPGSIVPLRITAREPVTLCVGGRPVARAELVEMDGELAARILTLLNAEGSP